MSAKTDAFSPFDQVLKEAPIGSPWVHGPGVSGAAAEYRPDYSTFENLLSVPLLAGQSVGSGTFATPTDAWLSHELRRAGFGVDEVWPRPTRPRILPRDVALLLDRLPSQLRDDVRDRVAAMPSVAPSDARILGRAYDKQVDVAISRWDRGPELLISTKAMVSGYGKNLGNRFEEAYGDAGNLRSRYPLAAVGYFFVQSAEITRTEPGAFERTKDMMRKLRELDGTNGYTATGLALVSWDPSDRAAGARIELDAVPEDIAPAQFLATMVRRVLDVTPVVHHVEVRERLEGRDVPIEITDEVEAIVSDSPVEAEDLHS